MNQMLFVRAVGSTSFIFKTMSDDFCGYYKLLNGKYFMYGGTVLGSVFY